MTVMRLRRDCDSIPARLPCNCIIKTYWNWYIAQCFMFVIYQKCIVTILLLTNLCIVITLGKTMICIFIISIDQLAKELFSIL